MKTLSVLLALIIFTFGAQAQNDYGGSGAFGRVINGDGWLRPGGGSSSNTIGGNILKIRLDGIASQKFGLGYERVLNEKLTIGLNAFYQLPQKNNNLAKDFGLFFETVIDNLSEQEGVINDIFVPSNYGFQGSEINKYFVMPEVRYYFKNAPRGMFASLYFKYRSYDYSNKLIYTDTFSTPGTPLDYDFDFNFTMNTASAGFALGFQTFLLKRVSLDFILFGIQYSSNIGDIKITRNNQPLPADIQGDVQEGVTYINENLPIVKDIFDLKDNTADLIRVESRFTSPSIRLPSVRLGIRF